MKNLIPTQRIFIVEFCREHLGKTDHELKFLTYDYVKGTVTFYYWCTQCLREYGEVQSYQVELSVEDWLKFMEFEEDGLLDN